jgi:hypothetical protein
MKKFKVVPAAHHASYIVDAHDIAFNKSPADTVALVDDKGNVVAVISIKNVAAVYRADS